MDDGALEVSHGKIIEGGKVKVVCPAGSAGQGVYLSCTKGYINVTESTCQLSSRCEGASVWVSGAEIFHDSLDHQEQVIVACPEGFTGSLELTCQKGMVLTEGICRRGCRQAGVAGLELELPTALRHEEQVVLDCPEGFTGQLPFQCALPTVSKSLQCEAWMATSPASKASASAAPTPPAWCSRWRPAAAPSCPWRRWRRPSPRPRCCCASPPWCCGTAP